MEAYVYYSIIIFGSFTILLYIYLLFEKISLRLMSNKRVKQIKELEPYIDSLLNAMEKSYPSDEDIKKVTNAASDKIKREVVEDRVIRYMELFTGFN
jgi:hypothetical protein